MFILQAAAEGCNIHRKQGVTVLELFIVIVIITILAGIAVTAWQSQVERENADNAKTVLKTLWQAERNLFAWKDRYVSLPELLASDLVDDPNNSAAAYEYEVTENTASTLTIKATRKAKTTGFQIDQDGNLTSF